MGDLYWRDTPLGSLPAISLHTIYTLTHTQSLFAKPIAVKELVGSADAGIPTHRVVGTSPAAASHL